MKVEHLPVHPLLAAYVKNSCVIESRQGGEVQLPFFADGNPGIIYQESEGGLFIGTRKLAPLFVYGQTVKPIRISTRGNFRLIIFYLHPYATRSLFRIASHEITDDCLDLSLYASSTYRELIARLACCNDAAQQEKLITRMLLRTIRLPGCTTDPAIGYAVQQILHTKGLTHIRQIQHELNISERTFERRFRQHVGVLPKLFARITQFRHAMEQVNSEQYGKLSDIAFDNGYADQSHFIRSFKEFTGSSPMEFQKQASPAPLTEPDGFVLF